MRFKSKLEIKNLSKKYLLNTSFKNINNYDFSTICNRCHQLFEHTKIETKIKKFRLSVHKNHL